MVLNIFTRKPAFGIQPLCSLSQGTPKYLVTVDSLSFFHKNAAKKKQVNQKVTNLLQPVNGRNAQKKSNQQRNPLKIQQAESVSKFHHRKWLSHRPFSADNSNH